MLTFQHRKHLRQNSTAVSLRVWLASISLLILSHVFMLRYEFGELNLRQHSVGAVQNNFEAFYPIIHLGVGRLLIVLIKRANITI